MNSKKVISLVIALVCLALIPVLWIFAVQALPSVETLRASGQSNTIGPLIFTWGLVVIGALAAILVAWLGYASVDRQTEATTTARGPEKPRPVDMQTRP